MGVIAATAIVLAGPLRMAPQATDDPPRAPEGEAQFVGSERCESCHPKAFEAWRGSHHAQSMQEVRDDTVLGDFGDATFEDRGKRWRFFKQGERFMVHAEGPDGGMSDDEVAYTFGVEPLQQYLVAFPGGRLQCLPLAWDTKARRWFPVRAGPAALPGDWLHWTRPGQNWNAMCADCHSTAVRKQYDPEKDEYRTRWSEISVGCEACHGPGSRHVTWAEQPAPRRAPEGNAALLTRTSGISARASVGLCAPCHARRSQVADQGVPGGEWMNEYRPALLTPGLFHADGQVLEEDFEWQAFTQSKMYAKGVRCTDCHDVHSGKLHREENALCVRCHQADDFDTPSHHFHKKDEGGKPSAAVLCVSCHMPGQRFMGVHVRRDHSIRIPRPDLTDALGVPNACSASGCHEGKPSAWIRAAYDARYGKDRRPHFGTTLAAGRRGEPGAEADLVRLSQDPQQPTVARATAMELLAPYPSIASREAFLHALGDSEPLLRTTAVRRLPIEDPASVARLLSPLLRDPVRMVRSEAAARLVGAPATFLNEHQRQDFARAMEEYLAEQRYMSDLPSGPFNLGNILAAQGRTAEAETQYRRALQIDGQLVAAKVNLAQLLSGQARGSEAELLLREARAQQPQDARIAFDLGLLFAERGRPDEAEKSLRAALAADARSAPAAFNLAVLIAERQLPEAIRLAQQAAALRPDEARYVWTLGYLEARAGDLGSAAATLESLRRTHPEHADTCGLLAHVYARQGRIDDAQALSCERQRPP